jgi:glyoxylase-like metal-dependent hydrolase (beta-lactamase superfamily II)
MKIHTLKGYIQNIFLVEYADKLLLLDGCGSADVNAVCTFITNELNRPLSDVKLIVVTHMHPDHAGGAHKLRDKTGAKIMCHPKAPSWYRSLLGRTAHLIDLLLMQYVAKRIGKRYQFGWYNPVLKPDAFLEDGQRLPEFEEWTAYYTPGHTDHDLSLYHQQTNKLYVADLIVKVKKRLHPPYPVCHPNQYRESLRKLFLLDNPVLMFAHVPETVLSHEDIEGVMALAPDKPKNHWHSTKARVMRVFGR